MGNKQTWYGGSNGQSDGMDRHQFRTEDPPAGMKISTFLSFKILPLVGGGHVACLPVGHYCAYVHYFSHDVLPHLGHGAGVGHCLQCTHHLHSLLLDVRTDEQIQQDTKITNLSLPVAREEQTDSLGEPGYSDQQDQGQAQQDQGGLQDEDSQGAHHHHQHPQGEGQQHHLQPDGSPRGGDKAVAPACSLRMPGSILLASQGGTCPRTVISNPDTNAQKVEVDRGSEAAKEDHHHGAGGQQPMEDPHIGGKSYGTRKQCSQKLFELTENIRKISLF
jgi:hypothetical protein